MTPMTTPMRMLLRGAAKRCPACGGGRLFTGWFRMADRCPTCAYRFEREEGFFLGAYAINLGITEGLVLLAIIPSILLAANDPDTSIVPILAAAVVAAVVAPLVFYPFSRTIWAAVDLLLRPSDSPEPDDRP